MASKLFQMYFFKYLNGYRLHFLGAAAIYWWKIFMTPGNPTQMLLLLFELLKKNQISAGILLKTLQVFLELSKYAQTGDVHCNGHQV